MDRAAFLKTLTLLRPALSTQQFIPALSHVRFAGDADGEPWATAYNDTHAVLLRVDWDEGDMCVPGDTLLRTLGSFKGDTFTVAAADEQNVVLACGRSKIKLHTLPAADFPFSGPKGKYTSITLDRNVLKGIERCLAGVGSNITHPEQMGVTLGADADGAVLYSTDNVTMSRYQTTADISLPGDAPVIMPTAFCENLLQVASAFPEAPVVLDVYVDALLARIGGAARVFSRMLVDLVPMDFDAVIGKHLGKKDLSEVTAEIPDTLGDALGRALLVLGGAEDKVTSIKPGGDVLKLHTGSDAGEADDSLAFELAPDVPTAGVNVDPSLVLRGAKGCAVMGFLPNALVLATADGSYVHLVAYCKA